MLKYNYNLLRVLPKIRLIFFFNLSQVLWVSKVHQEFYIIYHPNKNIEGSESISQYEPLEGSYYYIRFLKKRNFTSSTENKDSDMLLRYNLI